MGQPLNRPPVNLGRTGQVDPITSGISPYTGSWTENEVMHLLKRVCFGAPREQVQAFAGLSYADAVDVLVELASEREDLDELRRLADAGSSDAADVLAELTE